MGPTIQRKVFLVATFSLIAFVSYTRPALCWEGVDEAKVKAKAYFERAVAMDKAGELGDLDNDCEAKG